MADNRTERKSGPKRRLSSTLIGLALGIALPTAIAMIVTQNSSPVPATSVVQHTPSGLPEINFIKIIIPTVIFFVASAFGLARRK